MSDPKVSTLSKIERKIFKNTLLSNSNDLRFKEDTRKSQLSNTSKQYSSMSPKTFDMSHITQISNHQIDLIKLFSVQELDFSGISFQLNNESIENLQETIRISGPGSVITLPPKKLQFPSLLITSPITIKGLPGSCIEITKGSIVFEFTSHSRDSFPNNDKQSALICEIALQYSLNTNFKPSHTTHAALIVVDSISTFVEIRDCDLRSNNHEGQSENEEKPDEIEDVCF